MPIKTRQSGLSLIELIVFILIIGVALAGITVTYNVVVRGSADPMLRKQALAIAESLLLEIEQQAFTWCDPQDANATTAVSSAGCANPQSVLGPTAGETRGNPANPFDNVGDYNGYSAPGSDIVGGNANAQYTASVAITAVGGLPPFASMTFPHDAVLRIAVTVTGQGQSVTLVGYRSRYAPNATG